MGDLTPNAQKVYDALKKLGATNEEKLKTAFYVLIEITI